MRYLLRPAGPLSAFLALALLPGCAPGVSSSSDKEQPVLRIAVTTSTRDSGLLEELIPIFEREAHVRVDVIAVGTGAALKLGKAGDVDVVLVHAREAENAFVRAGHGIRREDLMYNMFQLLGPPQDPAGIRGMDDPAAALRRIAERRARFVSRGDESGTHRRELKLWADGGGLPKWSDYVESGQGMGATLTMADQMNAYVLGDRGTFLKSRKRIRLRPLVTSSPKLRNPYGILVVNPKSHARVNSPLAQKFVDFMISAAAQEIIRDYRTGGEQPFFPLRLPERD